MNRIVAPYFVIYFVVMTVFAVIVPWQQADWALYAWMNKDRDVQLSNEVTIVDVSYDQDRARFRSRVCGLLSALVTEDRSLPKAIALDIQIENEPAGLAEFERCVTATQSKGVKVYAAANPLDLSGNVTPQFLERHASKLYREVLDGFGHTRFDHLYGVAKYDPYLRLSENVSIPALPIKISEDLLGRPIRAGDHSIVLYLGNRADAERHTLVFVDGRVEGACSTANRKISDCLRGKIIVVGSLAADVTALQSRAGPELLAWALSERLLPSDLASPKPLTNAWLLIGLALGFSALTLWILGVILKHLPPMRGRLWLLIVMAAALAIGLLCLLVIGLSAFNVVYAQVTLIAIGIAATAVLSLAFLRKRALITDLNKGAPTVEEIYDIFISYSRTPENTRWVTQSVYEPLSRLTKADGSPVRIFFDQKSLRIGFYWFTELARAIYGSRLFVPVYSTDYFDKPFCKFEIEQAFIKEASQRGFVLPLSRGNKSIPQQYGHVQFLDADSNPGYVEELTRAVVQKLAPG